MTNPISMYATINNKNSSSQNENKTSQLTKKKSFFFFLSRCELFHVRKTMWNRWLLFLHFTHLKFSNNVLSIITIRECRIILTIMLMISMKMFSMIIWIIHRRILNFDEIVRVISRGGGLVAMLCFLRCWFSELSGFTSGIIDCLGQSNLGA